MKKKIKNIICFILITIGILLLVYAVPVYKVYRLFNKISEYQVLDQLNTNSYYGQIVKVFSSDANNDVKLALGNILKIDISTFESITHSIFFLFIYYGCIMTLILALIGIFLLKKVKDKKFLGKIFITSAGCSLIISGIVVYIIKFAYLA